MPRPPVLLALDTATSRCSVALARGGSIDLATHDVGQRHTEHVLPMVDAMLAAHAIELDACDAIAFGAGPGSFTGLRVACGAAQGLAYGIDRPVVAIGNLEATALEVFERNPDAQIVCVALDARMHEAYCGVYARVGNGVQELAAPALAAPADVVALAERHAADALAGTALRAYADDLRGFGGTTYIDIEAEAGAIARLAVVAFGQGRAVDAALAAPLYVRDRVALTIDERRAGARLAGQGHA
jgi:tRNA threonylcarbamoyladenosine biosynthesis protein TsaB